MVALAFLIAFLIWGGGYSVAKVENNILAGYAGWLKLWLFLVISTFVLAYSLAYLYIYPLLLTV